MATIPQTQEPQDLCPPSTKQQRQLDPLGEQMEVEESDDEEIEEKEEKEQR